MTIYVGIDPGKKSPAHVAFWGDHLSFSARPIVGVPGTACAFVEGQHRGTVGRGAARRRTGTQSLMTLSFYAGLHAGAYLDRGCNVWRLPVRAWRGVLIGARSANVEKVVFHNLVRGATPAEILEAGPDFIDAYWIGVAGQRLLASTTPAMLRKLKVVRLTY